MFEVLKTFAGIVSGKRGTRIEIKDKTIADDLIRAGYIAPLTSEEKPKKTAVKKEK